MAFNADPGRIRIERAILSCLAVVLVLEFAAWRVAHRNDPELQESMSKGSPREKVWSMHIFLNRGKSPSISRTQVEELLASEEAIVREFAMTCDVWRLGDPELQRQHLEQIADRGESIRSRYYMKPMGWKDMKPPLGRGVSRSELREYFRSLESVSRAEN